MQLQPPFGFGCVHLEWLYGRSDCEVLLILFISLCTFRRSDQSHSQVTDLLLKLWATLLTVWPRSNFIPIFFKRGAQRRSESQNKSSEIKILLYKLGKLSRFYFEGFTISRFGLCEQKLIKHLRQRQNLSWWMQKKMCLLTPGSSQARPPAGWIWEHQFLAKLFQSRSGSLWLAAHSSGCSHPWAARQLPNRNVSNQL